MAEILASLSLVLVLLILISTRIDHLLTIFQDCIMQTLTLVRDMEL